jgi:hypothetical protein
MTIKLQALVRLAPGCRLYYDCPRMSGDDVRSDRFFKEHGRKHARFVRYSEKHVGVLSHDGRMPGRYIDPSCVIIRFESEEEEHRLNASHFVVVDRFNATFAEDEGEMRLGDLPHPIEFWPDDVVRFREGAERPSFFTTNAPRVVSSINIERIFLHAGAWGYQVRETDEEHQATVNAKQPGTYGMVTRGGANVPGERLELISRGNVWALYNDPGRLVFASFEEEYEFWSRTGIAKYAMAKNGREGLLRAVTGYPLPEATALYEEGHGDIVRAVPYQNRNEPVRYELLKLHECFAGHRPHVRMLAKQWEERLKESFATALAG